MRIALVYDLRDDYRALGFSEEEVAEFDSVATIDALAPALEPLGRAAGRGGRGPSPPRPLPPTRGRPHWRRSAARGLLSAAGRHLPHGWSPASASISCSP